MYFGNMYTANAILNSNTPYEAKWLSYQINGTNHGEWREHGYDICYRGVQQKFLQNTTLLNMLKATAPLTLAEASKDCLWAIGVNLRDSNAFNQMHWQSNGWLSKMLQTITDEVA